MGEFFLLLDLSMKEGSLFLFCSYEIHRTGILQIVFFVSLESSRQGWAYGLGSMMFWLAVQKFLNIEWFLHWKFQRNWNVPLVLLERSWWAGFNGIYLVRLGSRMWEILIFKWFLLLKFETNSKKIRFWKEKSVKNVVALDGLPFNSSMSSFHIWLFKKLIHTLQNNVHMLNFPIL